MRTRPHTPSSSLDAEEMAEFEAHLATCEYCQEEVAEFAEALAELSLLTQATPSPTLRSNVLAVTQDAAAGAAPARGLRGRPATRYLDER